MYAKTFFSVPPLMVHGLLVRKSKMRNCLRKFKSTRIHGLEGKRWCLCILILVVIGQAYGLFYAFARIFIYERIPEKYVIDTRWNIGTCFKLTISVTPYFLVIYDHGFFETRQRFDKNASLWEIRCFILSENSPYKFWLTTTSSIEQTKTASTSKWRYQNSDAVFNRIWF